VQVFLHKLERHEKVDHQVEVVEHNGVCDIDCGQLMLVVEMHVGLVFHNQFHQMLHQLLMIFHRNHCHVLHIIAVLQSQIHLQLLI